MDEQRFDALRKTVLMLTQQVINLENKLTETIASVIVLKAVVATLLVPDNPLLATEKMLEAEKQVLTKDATAQDRQQVSATIQALQKWDKQGRAQTGES
jgi:regulator of replication initiation timing